MKLNPDDPRLTAYALGELPENERAEIEAALQQSPECREAVEEIRQTAKALSQELAAEPCPALSPAQKEKIEGELRSAKIIPLPRRKMVATTLVALAACITVMLVWQFVFTGELSSSKKPLTMATKVSTPEHLTHSGPPVELNTTPIGAAAPTIRVAEPDTAKDKTPATANLSKQPVNMEQPPIDAVVVSVPPAPTPNSAPVYSMKIEGFTQDARAKKDQVEFANAPTSTTKAADTLSFELSDSAKLLPNPPPVAPPTPTSRSYGNTLSVAQSQNEAQANSDTRARGGGTRLGWNSFGGTLDGPMQEGRGMDNWVVSGSEDLKRQTAESETGTARYPHLTDNSFFTALNSPLSTFSIDVDTASYANLRRFLNENRLPPRDAVRIEEMINYFPYQYTPPRGEDPFSASIEVAGCPWNPEHRLVRVGLKGREIARDKRPPSNFVFLIDVSGSMQPHERLPLIKQALRQLVKKMTENDRVAIVTYASSAGTRLESTSCAEKERILRAIDALEAGGSTNGGDGIQRAYRVAEENFIRDGVNRVLLCTDGDFNVGITDQGQLTHMVQEKAKSGVFLTTLGVGTDNYKDALMQKLADKGNGNYHYLDSLEEAQKVLIEQMSGTLVTIAKDVKIQIEFNPAQVNAYRLIGYEKRLLRKEDFNNDAKDAGEIGAGHTVTALYEIVPAGRQMRSAVDDLKYQPSSDEKPDRYVRSGSRELLTLKLRYKQPTGDRSRLLEFPISDNGKRFENASSDFRFAAAVAGFGMLLRDSEYKGNSSYDAILEWAGAAKGADEEGYRSEFLNLVRKAKELR